MSPLIRSPKETRKSSSDFIVRIKADPAHSLSGKIEHPASGETGYFQDYLELLLLMESKLNQTNYPQSDTELRTFNDDQKNIGDRDE